MHAPSTQPASPAGRHTGLAANRAAAGAGHPG